MNGEEKLAIPYKLQISSANKIGIDLSRAIYKLRKCFLNKKFKLDKEREKKKKRSGLSCLSQASDHGICKNQC